MDRDDAIKAIKTALKNRSRKSWSVTGGKGTAWGWIKIQAPPKRLDGSRMSDEDRADLASLLGLSSVHGQGCMIAASSAHYREYVDRAEGREPAAIAEPYWD